jgi:hypothetical protein
VLFIYSDAYLVSIVPVRLSSNKRHDKVFPSAKSDVCCDYWHGEKVCEFLYQMLYM